MKWSSWQLCRTQWLRSGRTTHCLCCAPLGYGIFSGCLRHGRRLLLSWKSAIPWDDNFLLQLASQVQWLSYIGPGRIAQIKILPDAKCWGSTSSFRHRDIERLEWTSWVRRAQDCNLLMNERSGCVWMYVDNTGNQARVLSQDDADYYLPADGISSADGLRRCEVEHHRSLSFMFKEVI